MHPVSCPILHCCVAPCFASLCGLVTLQLTMKYVVQMDGMLPLLLLLSRHSLPVLTSLVLSTRCAAEKLSVWVLTPLKSGV